MQLVGADLLTLGYCVRRHWTRHWTGIEVCVWHPIAQERSVIEYLPLSVSLYPIHTRSLSRMRQLCDASSRTLNLQNVLSLSSTKTTSGKDRREAQTTVRYVTGHIQDSS